MQFLIKYFLNGLLICSIASLKAMNAGDKDLERARAWTSYKEHQTEQDRALERAAAVSIYQQREQHRISEEREKKEALARQEQERKMRQQKVEEFERWIDNIWQEVDDHWNRNNHLLHYCHMGQRIEAQKMLEQGAFIDVDSDGKTALAHAIDGARYSTGFELNERHQLIKYLLSKGANVNARDDNGLSIMFFAAHAAPEIFKTILEENPDLTFVNRNNETVFDLLAGKQISDTAAKRLILQEHLKKIE